MEDTTQIAVGKTALVTGGARRIGAAISRELHARGANILLHYRSSSAEAVALSSELEQQRRGSCKLIKGDLLDQAFLDNIAETAVAAFGGLDLLINNASSFHPTELGNVNEDDWRGLMGTNLRAPFFLAQSTRELLRKRHGSIVNIVDIHAERPLPGFSIYNAAKAGLAGLTRSLAVELAPEIRVNGIAPGVILWPEKGCADDQEAILEQVPLQRKGEAQDIASAVRFLSLEAPYITGQILTVDGGRSLVL